MIKDFAIVCAHTHSFEPVAEITIYRNKAEYANRWGYDLLVRTQIDPKFSDPKSHVSGLSWDRIAFLARLVAEGRYRWIWCVGGDTMVTNFTTPLDTFTDGCESQIIATADAVAPIQADSFIIKCTPKVLEWLNDILATWPRLKHHTWVENQAMIELMPKYRDIIEILPQWMLNAYDYTLYKDLPWASENHKRGLDINGNVGQWNPGNFMIHWPAIGMNDRIRLANEIQPHIIR